MASRTCRLPLDRSPVIDVTAMGWGTHGSAGTMRTRVCPTWTLNYYPYQADWRIDGHDYALRPGCWSLTPPGMVSSYRFPGPCSHFYVLFSCPGGDPTTVPYLVDAGPRSADLLARLEDAKQWVGSHPARASALLWTVLWEYADLAGSLAPRHPVTDPLERAREVLEKRLRVPSRVSDVAADVGITPRHLQRMFLARYGCSIRAWLAQRRGEKLRHLLTSTDLPLEEVARQMGAGSLQHLYKISRRTLGDSPRGIRQGAR